MYSKLQQLLPAHDAGESSSIINRGAGDASNVRNFIDGVIIKVLTVFLTLTVYLIYMFKMHVGLTIACLASTPLIWVGAVVFSRLVQPAYLFMRIELSDVMIRTLVGRIFRVFKSSKDLRESQTGRPISACHRQHSRS